MTDKLDDGRSQPGFIGLGRSIELRKSLEHLWARLAPEPGLFPELPLDAVSARARDGEMAVATPRLLDLVIGERVTVEEAAASLELVGQHDWSETRDRDSIEAVLDAWWLEALSLDGDEGAGRRAERYGPDEVLGILVGYDAPLVRWLEPWLLALDGPGANHLASVVLRGLDGPAWHNKHDQASQVLGWARTEPVVNGMILIGGSHLEPEELSAVLDVLI